MASRGNVAKPETGQDSFSSSIRKVAKAQIAKRKVFSERRKLLREKEKEKQKSKKKSARKKRN